jgi:D-alanyl-D-alanine carboxypeptidase
MISSPVTFNRFVPALQAGRLLLMAAVILSFLLPADALAARPKKSSGNPRYGAIVMDADTGAVLFQSGADKTLHPASLAKMMTLALTFDALERGELRLRDRVTVSRHAASMVPSKLGIDPGSSIRVEDAIYAIVTKSANDVAVALAERVGGGTESRFAVMMNRKAAEIGMNNTHFVNASGLHHPRQVTTPRDMAKLARYILAAYPEYYHYFSTRQFTYHGLTHRNHNRLMESYKGMDGFKTGYVAASGFNLVASAKRGNHRLIGVVFGGQSANSRNAHMATLLNRGFERVGSPSSMLVAANDNPTRPPTPSRKPGANAPVLASYNTTGTATDSSAREQAMLQGAAFSEMIGEGDSDPAVSNRLETGLMAITALKEQNAEQAARGWAVQVGAFGSRAKTDRAIAQALNTLPGELARGANPAIAPLKTAEGWVFRGRLTGLTQEQAAHTCAILRECIAISPQTY